MLPNGWKKVGLFDVVSIESTLVDPKKEPYSEMNLIAPDHIQSETGVVLALVPAKEQYAISGKYLVKKGDVIYSKIRPYLKKACKASEECLCSADMYPLTVSDQMDSSFLLHMLLSETFTKYANSCSTRTGIPKINREDLALFQFYLPPIEEQKKIAATLLVWDSAIEKMEKLVEAKISQKKSVTYKLIENQNEVKFKLGNVTIDKSEWEKKRFKDVFEFLSTNTFSRELMSTDEGLIKNIHYGDVLIKYGELLDVDSAKIPCLKSSVDSSKMTFLQSGDIVIADTAEDETVGKAVEVLNVEDHLVVSGLHTMLCRPQKEMFYHGWLGYYINSKEFHRQLIPLITGIKVSSIAKKDIVDTIVLIPSFHEQKIIVETLSETNKELSLLKQQLENYKKQKQGLMQKLLTGQWRVK